MEKVCRWALKKKVYETFLLLFSKIYQGIGYRQRKKVSVGLSVAQQEDVSNSLFISVYPL